MAGTTFQRVDKHRLKKIYPTKRKIPRMATISDKSIILESGTIDFKEYSNKTRNSYTFTNAYEEIPTVTHGVVSDDGDIVIARIVELTLKKVVVDVSAPFNGRVDVQIIQVLE